MESAKLSSAATALEWKDPVPEYDVARCLRTPVTGPLRPVMIWSRYHFVSSNQERTANRFCMRRELAILHLDGAARVIFFFYFVRACQVPIEISRDH